MYYTKCITNHPEGIMNVCIKYHVDLVNSSYPSVTCAELPLASHHSSLVRVGPLHLPRQVFYLCFQLGLLVLKLQRKIYKKKNRIIMQNESLSPTLRKTTMIEDKITIIGSWLKIGCRTGRGGWRVRKKTKITLDIVTTSFYHV